MSRGDSATPTAALVVLAAGSGERAGPAPDGMPANKVLRPLLGRPVLAWSLAAASRVRAIGAYVVVAHPGEEAAVTDLVSSVLPGRDAVVVTGGATRHASEWLALQALAPRINSGELDVVALHDAARPHAPPKLFADVIDLARRRGGAVPGVQAPPLIAVTDAAPADLDELSIVAVQTPQAFRALPLLAAYAAADRDGFEGTDTASCLQQYRNLPAVGDLTIGYLPAPVSNLKITYANDFAVAARLPGAGG